MVELPPALPPALIVAGPTASGKSALALDLAERLGGTIINADAMQVYRELRIVTARPTAEEEARVPHRLYGVRPAAEPGSVAWWRGEALAAMEGARRGAADPHAAARGLYFAALTEGLADIPDPGPAARRGGAARWLRGAGAGGAACRACRGRSGDGGAAAADRQPARRPRLGGVAGHRRRARGVAGASGARRRRGDSPRSCSTRRARRCARRSPRRFAAMLRRGRARGGARRCWRCGLDPALPAMRAHGVPELAAHLRGEITLAEAQRRAELVTGQYTKRQATWFRHHALADAAQTHTIHARFAGLAQFSERELAEIVAFLRSRVDAPQHCGLVLPRF